MTLGLRFRQTERLGESFARAAAVGGVAEPISQVIEGCNIAAVEPVVEEGSNQARHTERIDLTPDRLSIKPSPILRQQFGKALAGELTLELSRSILGGRTSPAIIFCGDWK